MPGALGQGSATPGPERGGQGHPGRRRSRGGRAAEVQVPAARGAPARHRRLPAPSRPGFERGPDPTWAAGWGGSGSVPHLGPRRRLWGPGRALGVSRPNESPRRVGNAPGNTRPPPLPPGAGALPARPLPPSAPPSALLLQPSPSALPCLAPSPDPAVRQYAGPRSPPAAENAPQGREPPGPPAGFGDLSCAWDRRGGGAGGGASPWKLPALGRKKSGGCAPCPGAPQGQGGG